MGAYERLVAEGKRAARALEASTPWSRHSWARAVRSLERAGLFPTIGLEQVMSISARTGLDPEAVADLLVLEAREVVARQAADRAGTMPDRGHVVVGDDSPPGPERAGFPHEATTVCHSARQDQASVGARHQHDCRRLSGHGPSHSCACGEAW